MNVKVYKFKIFDLNANEFIYESKIDYEPLIGRLKSGTFTFIKGHIYYKNNVIKIRYDQIDKSGVKELKEDQLFDYYENILSLG